MAKLPKMRYNGSTKYVKTLRINGVEMFNQNFIENGKSVRAYHKHTGSSSSGGGCYSKPNYHKHDPDKCYDYHRYTQCDTCSKAWGTSSRPAGMPCSEEGCPGTMVEVEHKTLSCSKTESTIDSYSLNCGYDQE